MGQNANTAGGRPGGEAKRRSATAALLAALWPSLLGPEHGDAWRAQNRRVWRRRLTHVALIAGITGIGAVAAAPPFHRVGDSAVPYDEDHGTGASAHGGPAAGGSGHGLQHPSVAPRLLDGGGPHKPESAEPYVTPLPEDVGSHDTDVATDAEGHDRPVWEPTRAHSPTLAHYSGGFGRGGAFGGGGGAGAGGGGPSDGSSQGAGAPGAGDSNPGQHTDPFPPGGPQTPDKPPYIVDLDDGQHQDDPKWNDWRPQTNSPQVQLSPVPEPQTWVMMIIGFGLLGGALRLQRRAPGGLETRRLTD